MYNNRAGRMIVMTGRDSVRDMASARERIPTSRKGILYIQPPVKEDGETRRGAIDLACWAKFNGSQLDFLVFLRCSRLQSCFFKSLSNLCCSCLLLLFLLWCYPSDDLLACAVLFDSILPAVINWKAEKENKTNNFYICSKRKKEEGAAVISLSLVNGLFAISAQFFLVKELGLGEAPNPAKRTRTEYIVGT